MASLAPWLSVRNAAKALNFYKTAFGATEAYRFDGPDSSIVARLSIGGAEFWIGDDSSGPPETEHVPSVRMILTVSDPDALFAQVLRAGATQICPVSEDHGWRIGRLADPFGHHWEIGREL